MRLSNPIPLLLRSVHQLRAILSQDVAFLNQDIQSPLELPAIIRIALVSIFDSNAWIVRRSSIRRSSMERHKRAQKCQPFSGRAHGRGAQIPSCIRSQRSSNLRQTDPTQIIAVLVHLRYQRGIVIANRRRLLS